MSRISKFNNLTLKINFKKMIKNYFFINFLKFLVFELLTLILLNFFIIQFKKFPII